MTESEFGSGAPARAASGPPLVRWECRCQQPPVLLATYGPNGLIHIKARDRYWHVRGSVQTVCPRCGGEHQLDLSLDAARPAGQGQ